MESNRTTSCPLTLRKKRILIFTETKWAFGQIYGSLKKYSKRLHFDLHSWAGGFSVYLFNSYDLVCTTDWITTKMIIDSYPQLGKKLFFNIHGMIDFYRRTFHTNQHVEILSGSGRIADVELLRWLQTQSFSVVSKEIAAVFNSFNMYPCITPCGVDDEIFYPSVLKNKELVVIFTPLEIDCFNSRVKRSHFAGLLKNEITTRQLNMRLLQLPYVITDKNEMAEFYRQGDVFLCLSHSEGNPLGAFEAGACGLTVISTPVGVMTEMIKDGENGFIIQQGSDEEILASVMEKLTILENDPSKCKEMQKAMRKEVLENWNWRTNAAIWEDYIDSIVLK